MPIHSAHPPIVLPSIDVWTFLFEESDRDFPDDHGQFGYSGQPMVSKY
jgi:4-coumarate--CoA ligase